MVFITAIAGRRIALGQRQIRDLPRKAPLAIEGTHGLTAIAGRLYRQRPEIAPGNGRPVISLGRRTAQREYAGGSNIAAARGARLAQHHGQGDQQKQENEENYHVNLPRYCCYTKVRGYFRNPGRGRPETGRSLPAGGFT